MDNFSIPVAAVFFSLFLHIFVLITAGPIHTTVPSTVPTSKEQATQIIEITPAHNTTPDERYVVKETYNDTKKYLVIDDMIITKDQSRSGLVNNAWPNGIVPYVVSLSISPQQRVMVNQAIGDVTSKTCIQFRAAKQEDNYWLLIQNDPTNQGCSSFVGWQNRRNQPVQISQLCSRGNLVHELIHALGFFHEQTRNDRDDFVKVFYENVQQGYETNFKKESEMDPPPDTTFYNVPYNYDSIMHYGRIFFSKNGQPTIEPLNNPTALGNGSNIGQRDGMSPGDIQMINNKYNCGSANNAPPGDEPPAITDNSGFEPVTSPVTEEGASSQTTASSNSTGKPLPCGINPAIPGC